MTPEAPEFHTKTLSPISPLPVHLPEPSTIPVLRNQIDPVFNMTSTHLDPDPVVAASAESIPQTTGLKEDSPSVDSSFSDAYKDESEVVDIATTAEMAQPADDDDDDDDYAMTFDSDGEENTDSHDVSRAINEPETKSLPTTVLDTAPLVTMSQEPPTHELSNIGPSTHSPSLPTAEAEVVDAAAAILPDTNATSLANETDPADRPSYDDIANGGIDIQQLLDNITANAEKNAPASPTTTAPPAHPPNPPLSIGMNGSGLPPHSSLPPRPNIAMKRQHADEAHNYYAGAPGLPPASNSYRPPGGATAIIAAGAPGTSTDPRGGLPPPPGASFRSMASSNSNPASPASYMPGNQIPGPEQPNTSGSQHGGSELDAKWGPDIQKKYDAFLEDERHYVNEGLWDRFPVGSRLFIGNLPSELVTKRDLFHVFHHYGRIAQVSIKQAYGFVQFHDSAACYAALQREQGTEVRERKIHLEISKPQKNTRNADQGGASQRMKSSDHSRGNSDGGRARGNDRYDARSSPAMRTDEYGRPIRIRDDYRPARQPSPPRGGFRGRDEYSPRGRDSYDGRDRRRERSRSPYDYRDEHRYRERSLSPRAREAVEDADLQIPRRDPSNVPDVQIILLDQLDRQFVSWVENEMRGRGITIEVMFLSPRLPLQAVIRRQILEGVYAVSKLDMRTQNSSKVPLQVFDRQGGANNVRFDEYQDLEPKIAAELVIRAKQTQAQHQTPQYSQPQYPSAQAYQPPAPAPAPAPVLAAPNLANLVGSLDNATLQKLLGTLSTAPQQNPPAAATNPAFDLAGLLGGFAGQQNHNNYMPPPNPQPDPYSAGSTNAVLASLLGHGVQQQQQQQPAITQPQQSAQQVQNIMAQLAKYRQ